MKIIKFRAWDRELKVMHPHVQDWYDTLSEQKGEPEQTEQCFYHLLTNKRYSVMQYTGFKDKNSKETYEGDIVKLNERIGKINNTFYAWEVRFTKSRVLFWNIHFGDMELEVIGNVWENPNLI
jgi:uncharacterized phage protein (TIGR01671 family)